MDVNVRLLLQVLNRPTSSLGEVETAFQGEFPRTEQFRACLVIAELISDRALSLVQVLLGEWLLFHFNRAETAAVHRQQAQQCCFAGYLLARLDNEIEPGEKAFLYNIMSSSSVRKDYSSKSIKTILKSIEASIYDKNGTLKPFNINKQNLRRQFSIEDTLPLLSASGLRSWFRTKTDISAAAAAAASTESDGSGAGPAPGGKVSATTMSESDIEQEAGLYAALFADRRTYTDIKPILICPPPPILPVPDRGLLQLSPLQDAAGLLWLPPRSIRFDDSSTDPPANGAAAGSGAGPALDRNSVQINEEFKAIFSNAILNPLSPQQQQKLLQNVKFNLPLVIELGLTPQNLPSLVENNSNIAMECLLHIFDDPGCGPYVSALTGMGLTLHSLEVVNRLSHSMKLSLEHINRYISNCIVSCEDMKDIYLQNRLVRLLCVFLQSLVRNKIINSQDALVEVQAFCVEFFRIREAATLYRMLKSLESSS